MNIHSYILLKSWKSSDRTYGTDSLPPLWTYFFSTSNDLCHLWVRSLRNGWEPLRAAAFVGNFGCDHSTGVEWIWAYMLTKPRLLCSCLIYSLTSWLWVHFTAYWSLLWIEWYNAHRVCASLHFASIYQFIQFNSSSGPMYHSEYEVKFCSSEQKRANVYMWQL